MNSTILASQFKREIRQSIVFYYNCFSVGDPEANPYVNCLILSIKSLIRSGTYQNGDKLVILTDPGTAKVLSGFSCLRGASLLVMEQTHDVFNGVLNRYAILQKLNIPKGVRCIYLDCDLLFIKKWNPTFTKHWMAVPEGKPGDSNYCGDYSLEKMEAGCSSTLFGFIVSNEAKAILDATYYNAKRRGESFYTLDQPYYNQALNCRTDLWAYFPGDMLSFNGHTNKETAVILNLCGDPGDGKLHFRKMLDCF